MFVMPRSLQLRPRPRSRICCSRIALCVYRSIMTRQIVFCSTTASMATLRETTRRQQGNANLLWCTCSLQLIVKKRRIGNRMDCPMETGAIFFRTRNSADKLKVRYFCFSLSELCFRLRPYPQNLSVRVSKSQSIQLLHSLPQARLQLPSERACCSTF